MEVYICVLNEKRNIKKLVLKCKDVTCRVVGANEPPNGTLSLFDYPILLAGIPSYS